MENEGSGQLCVCVCEISKMKMTNCNGTHHEWIFIKTKYNIQVHLFSHEHISTQTHISIHKACGMRHEAYTVTAVDFVKLKIACKMNDN